MSDIDFWWSECTSKLMDTLLSFISHRPLLFYLIILLFSPTQVNKNSACTCCHFNSNSMKGKLIYHDTSIGTFIVKFLFMFMFLSLLSFKINTWVFAEWLRKAFPSSPTGYFWWWLMIRFKPTLVTRVTFDLMLFNLHLINNLTSIPSPSLDSAVITQFELYDLTPAPPPPDSFVPFCRAPLLWSLSPSDEECDVMSLFNTIGEQIK